MELRAVTWTEHKWYADAGLIWIDPATVTRVEVVQTGRENAVSRLVMDDGVMILVRGATDWVRRLLIKPPTTEVPHDMTNTGGGLPYPSDVPVPLTSHQCDSDGTGLALPTPSDIFSVKE